MTVFVDVTVISCLYGETHDEFVEDWSEGIKALKPFPSGITIVACDRPRRVLGGRVVMPCDWKHPHPYYLQQALELVDTEWVWIHDIDDVARSNALRGIHRVDADVWQLGFYRSDGETYVPPQLDAADVLQAEKNPFVGTSCIRTRTLREVGGFPDVALQDWALWRRLALAGATFQSSSRVHFDYRLHEKSRSVMDATANRRAEDLREMLDAEGLVAYTP
jgi:hypothetical protein